MADTRVKRQMRDVAVAGRRAARPDAAPRNGKGGMGGQSPLAALPEASSDAAVYDAVYEAVMDHRLAPGTRLTEASLCGIFGVSRAVVRMALLRLSHDRIVALTPNRGASIARPSVQETREVFELRRLLEAAAMELAAERALPRELDALRVVAKQEHAAFDSGDVRQWIRLSREFHLRLLGLAKNAELGEVGRDLITRSLLMTALYMPLGQTTCASHEHEELIDLLAAGEGRRAARLMTAHLLACEARLRLDAPDDAAAPDLAAALGRPRPAARNKRGRSTA
jgi:DNA-binding GntR family transcriptional regulator